MTTSPTMTAAPPAGRPLPEIVGAVGLAGCDYCRQMPGQPCAHSLAGSDGVHVARLVGAFRRGLVSGPELITTLQAMVCFTVSTVVYQDQADEAQDDQTCPRCGSVSWGMTPDGLPECTRCLWPGGAP